MITRLTNSRTRAVGPPVSLLAALVVILAVSAASAQPVIQPRDTAAEGVVKPSLTVRETDIAAGIDTSGQDAEREVVAVYMVIGQGTSPGGVGYSIARKNHLGEWEWQQEGLIPPGNYDPAELGFGEFDPSIAYNPVTGDYVVVGAGVVSGSERLIWAHYLPARAPFSGGWSADFSTGNSTHKPWITTGQMDATQQEFYLVTSGAQQRYGRSLDGGYTWTFGGFPPGHNYAQIIASPNAPNKVYAATFSENTGEIGLYEGTDDPNTNPGQPSTWTLDPNGWQPLKKPDGSELSIGRNTGMVWWGTSVRCLALPANYGHQSPAMVDLDVDPADPNVLYVVYDDSAAAPVTRWDCADPNETDVNVYLERLRRQADGKWITEVARQQVNDPTDPPNVADDFMVTIEATPGPGPTPSPAQTRLHVAYYSDRKETNQKDTPSFASGCDNSNARFDVFYSYSEDAATSFGFEDIELDDGQVPSEPAVDFALLATTTFEMRDYIGLAVRPKGNGYQIWFSFMGSKSADPNPNKSVIWGAVGEKATP